ncbi:MULTISPECIES: cupin domain-containing protein [unclassified Paracoccus (in: a-proteobacteria)]|uniref:cupin domain-containing protein n=1 Tax=unclassified Paracoccus (in: a-proteobacteria) TaxID=2688777 RepID=UPI0012B323E0|nr:MULTISPECIES: cupin domain-containing protein [unclassified Paracoccus (in: a-proteobacteria)]UXU74635.1 cupin domain-containing protein [Paracoccus sp. SMMA_5]UXU80529.1 cupin domain-containing protein [Paracoccus sp. SMMA_5_TC]
MSDLGAQYFEVPAGKSAFPRHNHHCNEEFFVILAGSGKYRMGDREWSVGAGDVIAAPAGDASTAHRLTNTGSDDLRYLVISTRHDPDVVEYPDSSKLLVAAGIPPGQGLLSARFRHIGWLGQDPDYWANEPGAEAE